MRINSYDLLLRIQGIIYWTSLKLYEFIKMLSISTLQSHALIKYAKQWTDVFVFF